MAAGAPFSAGAVKAPNLSCAAIRRLIHSTTPCMLRCFAGKKRHGGGPCVVCKVHRSVGPHRAVATARSSTLVCAVLCSATRAYSQPARCSAFSDDFYAQAEHDFAPFHDLSEWDAQRTKSLCQQQGEACFVVQVRGGQLFVSQEQKGFQSRNRLTMAFLQRVATKLGPLPDAEFVVDTSDGYMHIEAPLFVISKFPQSAGGILYPDFSSYSWPESECPDEAVGSHVWSQVRSASLDVGAMSWHEKSDQLFWRGAATSVYRQQIVPKLAALLGENVSFMEWAALAVDGGRQEVGRGTCVPLAEWCQYKFLANLPGNTMALALKYRLLCGSVVVTPAFWFHEWYYSQLQAGIHYVEVDPMWKNVEQVLGALRSDVTAAENIAAESKHWAAFHLSEDAMDCYWYRLIELAHRHFPPPAFDPKALPFDHAVLFGTAATASTTTADITKAAGATDGTRGGSGLVQSEGAKHALRRPHLDVAIVIPARASDVALMDWARRTWLRETAVADSAEAQRFTRQHYFVLAAEDPDIAAVVSTASQQVPSQTNDSTRLSGLVGEDILVVDCPHGYTWLLQKMAFAYRALLAAFHVKFFLRADVDSVIPLQIVLPLLPLASRGDAVVRVDADSTTGCGPVSAARWRSAVGVGPLACQTECSVDRGCWYFIVETSTGTCATFGLGCRSRIVDAAISGTPIMDNDVFHKFMPRYDVYEYRLRGAVQAAGVPASSDSSVETSSSRGSAFESDPAAFVLGTILYENKVLYNDTHNPQWNNRHYREDLGLSTYPPYPEASGYAMSAQLAAFLANVGEPETTLEGLAWKAWAIEDTALGTALAGLDVTFLQLPVEVRERMRVIRMPRSRPP